MINTLAIVSKGLINGYIFNTIDSLMGLLIVPLLCFMVAEFVGRHVQSSFGYAFGAHTQAIFGGLGAILHELYSLIVAFVCGHSLRMTHMQTLYNMKMGFKLDSAGHMWSNHSIWNRITSFFLGVLPYYMMVFTLLGCQKILGGIPLPTNVVHTSLKSYIGLSAWKTMLFHSLENDFSVSVFGFFILVVIVILLCLDGFNISSSENSQAFEGIIPWGIIVIITSLISTTLPYGKLLKSISLITLNVSIWATMKVIWCMLGVWIIVLCFSIINHTSDAVKKVGTVASNHRINKGGKIKSSKMLHKHHFNLGVIKGLLSKKPKQANQQLYHQPQMNPQSHQQIRVPVQHRYVNIGNPNGLNRQKPINPNMNPNYNPMPNQPNNRPNPNMNSRFRPQPRRPQNHPQFQQNQRPNNRNINQQRHPQSHPNPNISHSWNNQQVPNNNQRMRNPQPQMNRPQPNPNNMRQQPIQNNNQMNPNMNTNQPQPNVTNNIPQSQNKGIKGKIKNFFIKLDNDM